MTEALKMYEFITDFYDGLCEWPTVEEFYGQSGFLNFGYWEKHTGSQREACENLMDQLLALMPDKSGNVLDVACGKGETSACLARFFEKEVIGINVSEKQLEIARENVPQCRFMEMSATELEFPDCSMDNVFSVEAAFHFFTREEFLQEARRVLKPGGRLVLSDLLMTLEAERNNPSHTEKNYLDGPGAYGELLEKLGFVDVQVRDVTQECWIGHFWHAILYFNQQFLDGKIDKPQLDRSLRLTYRRVNDITHYLFVSCSKPAE